MPTNSEILERVLLDHFPEWEEFVHTSSLTEEREDCFEVLRLVMRRDLGGHTLSVFNREDTFEIAYNDSVARGPAEQQIIFSDRSPEEGALAVVEWRRDFIDERIVVVRYKYKGLTGDPYTLISFRRSGQSIKKASSVISWRGTYDYDANAV
jgi:hypothetical protein